MKYTPEIKQEVIRKHLEEGRSAKSLTNEYNLGQGTIAYWMKTYRKDPTNKEALEKSAEMLKLEKEVAELRKENDFLKKASAFFAKEIG